MRGRRFRNASEMSYDYYDYDARASSKNVIASSLIHTTLDLVLCFLNTLTCYNA